ncbi:MBOAT family O-acyltransferase [Rhizobium sp. 1399]|uniref:MBOAT family O-acyltransferase n=1 Tax=Rhizobium sp. 1399 TaxID=2817758 RepID=UPI00286295C6|nr:MBOAT family O-acyltransferase [Rhizobium sp. 1399]MDR6664968.1 D-alanyl-lipoteichoic acid acyltransferase DltB (MBOAT superfamily) [Rhizobium sp. 1399]
MVIASLFFYSHWNVKYLPVILISIGANFLMGQRLANSESAANGRKFLLAVSITANIFALAYFKYTNFFINNANLIFSTGFDLKSITLPLAISFFTFTQIVYLVDSYKGETSHYNILNYALFVTFFPHLIAGPIVQHSHIMPQFASPRRWRPSSDHILQGLFIFGIGLFKKAGIADTLAPAVAAGFDHGRFLNFYEAWVTSLAYTFQLYFDFSGYCDMAIGASLMFNIVLPINFNSPYKALNIQEFWRRWHITLSGFLRDFIYIPLGGSRMSKRRTYINLLITFALGGLWHGATWMFVLWGVLHGLALVVHRVWTSAGLKLPKALAWLVTFLFINISWVLFRAEDWSAASKILWGMIDIQSAYGISSRAAPVSDLAWGGSMADQLAGWIPAHLVGQLPLLPLLIVAFFLICQKNSMELVRSSANIRYVLYGSLLFSFGLYFTLVQSSTVFLYFNF